MKVSVLIGGDASGAVKAAEDAKRAVTGIERATESATIDARDFAAALKTAGNDLRRVDLGAVNAGRSVAAAGAAAQSASAAFRLNNAQMQNMSFQMNDIATMLASGQSPFVLLMQQGMQIAQIFGPGVGVAAAMKATGAALLAFVTNPLTLMVVGLAAAAGAAQFLWRTFMSGADDAEAALERHEELVDQVRAAYVRAGGSVDDWREAIERVTLAQAQQNLSAAQAALRAGTAGLRFGNADMIAMAMNDARSAEFADIRQTVRDLNTEVATGWISVEEYRRALDSLARNTDDSGMRAWIASLIEASDEALTLAQRVREAEDAVAALDGTMQQRAHMAAFRQAHAGSAVAGFDGGRFDFAVGQTEEMRKEAEAAAKRASDEASRAAKRQVEELKRLAAAWTEEAAPAAERYMRQLERLDEARSYFETEADYLRARVKLQDDMVDAIERERQERLAAATDFASGAQRAFETYARDAADKATVAERLVTTGFKTMEDAAATFATGAKVSIADMARSIIADLMRIAVRQAILGPLANAFGGLFGGGGVATGAPMNLLPAHHGGYGPGDPVRPSRFVSSAEIAAAPRYHAGRMKSNERAAVLTEDESVLTPGQMRAMGGPREVTVKLELVDEGGAPVAARNGGRRREGGVDIQRLIVGAAADDIAQGGPLSAMVEGTYGLSRRTR